MYPPSNATALDTRLEPIRKTTVAFANLFKDIPFIKYDNITGEEIDRIKVPIIYGDKEKYTKRLDVASNEKVQITLPRLEYGLINMVYDASRKMNQANKIVGCSASGSAYVNSPMPYNFNFELVLYTRNIEDANQIMEYILPHFYPDYNLKINFVPEAGIIKNVPITFMGESEDEDSSGTFDSAVRSVFRTLQFTARSYIFQPPKYYKPILWTNTNIEIQQSTSYIGLGSGNGNFYIGDTIYQGDAFNTASAKGIILNISSNNKILQINPLYGTFTANSTIENLEQTATYNIQYANGNKIAYNTLITPVPNTYPVVGPYEYNIVTTDYTK